MKQMTKASVRETVGNLHLPRYHEIPDVGLYLDQVVKYIGQCLNMFGEVSITASMISNYVKKGLVDNPVKKQYDRQRIAYLYAIATAKAFRGRGLCRALMEDTHRHLTAAGYAGAVLVPGAPTLFQLYEKMGYTVCSCVAEIAPQAAVEPAGLREIDTDTYAALRRQFLPEGGVLQEAESLAFLQAQASLYAGEHFVLAARREGASLRGLELLGDPGAAPAILTALGCSKGHFRTSGNGRPFAMYHPLDDAVPPPTYFGLAFD